MLIVQAKKPKTLKGERTLPFSFALLLNYFWTLMLMCYLYLQAGLILKPSVLCLIFPLHGSHEKQP